MRLVTESNDLLQPSITSQPIHHRRRTHPDWRDDHRPVSYRRRIGINLWSSVTTRTLRDGDIRIDDIHMLLNVLTCSRSLVSTVKYQEVRGHGFLVIIAQSQ